MSPLQAMTPRGMALIAVLWLVAAMGLILAGVAKSVRLEAQSVGLQRHASMTGASADAVLLLALQGLQAQTESGKSASPTLAVSFKGQHFTVQVQSLNSLIDINEASLPLLTDLYRYVGGLGPEAATLLAQATLNARHIKDKKGSAVGFDSVEDLLNVEGFKYDLYAKIANDITADIRSGNGRVYPPHASLGVLLALTAGDAARAQSLIIQRDAGPSTLDVSFLRPEFIDMSPSSSRKLQVSMPMPDGTLITKRWIVALVRDSRSGLPWRILSTSQSVMTLP